jgi:hypothetical protein
MREADVDIGLIYRDRIASPKVDTLQKIATAVGLTLPQIMGFEPAGPVPREVVAQAVRCVRNCVGAGLSEGAGGREEALISALQMALNMLLKHRELGYPIDAPETTALVESAIAGVLANADVPASEPATPPKTQADTANRSGRRDTRRAQRR